MLLPDDVPDDGGCSLMFFPDGSTVMFLLGDVLVLMVPEEQLVMKQGQAMRQEPGRGSGGGVVGLHDDAVLVIRDGDTC